MTERYMVDDAGTLIDMQTRDTYDYVSEICPILNEKEAEIKRLETQLKTEGTVCVNCKHYQLNPSPIIDGYYISECQRGHSQCSREDIKYCKDFTL